MHLHRNAWFVRHARRILQERAAAPTDVNAATKRLRTLFQSESDERQKLRALWTLFVMHELQQDELIELLQHESPHVRRWAVRFLVDQKKSESGSVASMEKLAHFDPSVKVRLALACAL